MMFRLWVIDKCKLYDCEFGLDYKIIRKVTGSLYNREVRSFRELQACCDRWYGRDRTEIKNEAERIYK